MKKSVLFALSLALFSGFYSCGDKQNNGNNNVSNNAPISDSTSLAFGVSFGMNMQGIGFTTNEIKTADFIKGFEAAFGGKPSMDKATSEGIVNQDVMAMQMKRQNPTSPAPTFSPQLSEAIGNLIGTNIQQIGFSPAELKVNEVAQGFESCLAGKPAMDGPTMQRVIGSNPKVQAFEQAQKAKIQEQQAAQEKAGVDFLAANKSKKGVQTTASGLQYQVVKEGKGKKPTLANTVKVHYHGTLIDGTVFDSSVDRGKPIEFPLNGVIPGWQEGVALMSEGAKYKLFIPHQLGYGAQPSGKIPPFSTLIFDVELISIVK